MYATFVSKQDYIQMKSDLKRCYTLSVAIPRAFPILPLIHECRFKGLKCHGEAPSAEAISERGGKSVRLLRCARNDM